MSEPVYLDYNATTPVAPEVLEAMLPFLRDQFGNPSSAHPLGRRAALAVAEARERVAILIGAQPQEIVFTGCATEANNLALTVGSACHSEHDAVSGVLAAMGLDASRAFGAVRLSVGRMTTAEDVRRAADGLAAAWRRLAGT